MKEIYKSPIGPDQGFSLISDRIFHLSGFTAFVLPKRSFPFLPLRHTDLGRVSSDRQKRVCSRQTRLHLRFRFIAYDEGAWTSKNSAKFRFFFFVKRDYSMNTFSRISTVPRGSERSERNECSEVEHCGASERSERSEQCE